MNLRHYEILGLDKNATQEDIKKAYRENSKKFRTDRTLLQMKKHFLFL